MAILRHVGIARAPLVAFAAMGVLWGAYAAMIPDTKAMLGVSDAGFGALILATPLAAVASMLLAPRLAPRLGRHVLPLSVMAMALTFALPGWLAVPAAFAAAMLLVGATNGFLDVVMTARVSALEADHDMHLMNLNHAAYSFGYAGAAVATGLLRTHGLGPAEVLTGAAVLIAALSALTFERGEGVNVFARPAVSSGPLGSVPFWGGVIVLIAFMSENASENWSALHIERTLGGSPAEGSFGPAVLALTMGVGRIFGQILVARTDERRLLSAGALVTALGLAIAGLAPTPAVAYVGLVVAGLGGSVLAPTGFALVGRLSPPGLRARILARTTAFGYMGYFFGPPALGMISELAGLRFSFVAMAVAVLLVIVVVPVLLRAGAPAAAAFGGETPIGTRGGGR